MVSNGWPDSEPSLPQGFVHVDIAGPVHDIEYLLVRRGEPARALLNHFWTLAKEVSAETTAAATAA